MRILGLDYGSKTVGVAVSDPLGLTAQKLETIWRKQENKLRKTLARIEELVAEYGVEQIVVGLPKNMNNTLGERGKNLWNLKKRWREGRVCLLSCGTSVLPQWKRIVFLWKAACAVRTEKSIWFPWRQFLYCSDFWIL